MQISFNQKITAACPQMRLGCLSAQVVVEEQAPELWAELQAEVEQMAQTLDSSSIKEWPTIAAARQAYKALGKDPSRYRPSAEALLRRVSKGKGLYDVNNVVNLINWISMRSGFSIGGYDAKLIQGTILMSVGTGEDEYQGLGRGSLNIDCLPCLRDGQGAFGSPTSDSHRTAIQLNTTHCLWVFFDFDSDHSLQQRLDESQELLKKFAQGTKIQQKIVAHTDT